MIYQKASKMTEVPDRFSTINVTEETRLNFKKVSAQRNMFVYEIAEELIEKEIQRIEKDKDERI